MISLATFRSFWRRPTWAVLLVVCVLLKSFTVTVTSAHESDHGSHDAAVAAHGDAPLDDAPAGDGNDGSQDPLHRLLHANHCCLHDGLAILFSFRPTWVAYPQSSPATTTTGDPAAHHGPLLRPPRFA